MINNPFDQLRDLANQFRNWHSNHPMGETYSATVDGTMDATGEKILRFLDDAEKDWRCVQKASDEKPIVTYEYAYGLKDFADGDRQYISLVNVENHPLLGNTRLIHTLSIVRIETKNTIYVQRDPE